MDVVEVVKGQVISSGGVMYYSYEWVQWLGIVVLIFLMVGFLFTDRFFDLIWSFFDKRKAKKHPEVQE